jgi:hypothetical protein
MIRKLLVDKVRNKAFIQISLQVRYMPQVSDMSVASWHAKQIVVFQIEEDLDHV